MKKSVYFIFTALLALVVFAFYNPMSDSKVGHVDTEYIFKKIPAYQDAQTELDNLANSYKAEIEAKYKEVDSLYKLYQKEEVLLPQETKLKKQNEIISKENEAKKLQKKYFGQGGLMDQKREELLKPIQDNVYNAIKEIAEEGDFDYIFDKATGEILYARPSRDQSDAVLKKLGH
jgi:outer membrane protein